MTPDGYDVIFAARRRIATGRRQDPRGAELPAAGDQEEKAGDHGRSPENCATSPGIAQSLSPRTRYGVTLGNLENRDAVSNPVERGNGEGSGEKKTETTK